MSAKKVASFAPLRADVADILGHINYATMTTVDRRGRPRSRVLIAVWELDGDRPLGWLGTGPSAPSVRAADRGWGSLSLVSAKLARGNRRIVPGQC